MQSRPPLPPPPGAGKDKDTPPRGPRPASNEPSAPARSNKRLSLHTSASRPRDPSPGPASPRPPNARTPSSPLPATLRRSSSAASLTRAPSPSPSLVVGRKPSSSSLRGDASLTPRASASRRSSFAPSMASPMGAKSPLEPHCEEKPPLRACDIAEEHFRRDLARHDDPARTPSAGAGTLVVVHDQCYGHRYSRPKTPKNMLSLIMERPERILATVLGISTAYVRLGGRHADGHNPVHPDHSPPERIPFRIRKTSRLVDITSPVVTNVHGTKWMEELKSLCVDAGTKLATTGQELARDTSAAPGQPPKHEFHAGDLYLCDESLNAFQGALGGVLDAVDAVFQANGPTRAFVCVRPPGHHCSADFPSGFCWLNNVHVGIEHAMMQYGLTHAAIIDFDLHHGDGSQAITWARNKKVQNMHKSTANRKKTSIGYFSLHDINSYPCEDGDDDKVQAASLCIDNAHGQSIWNVHLQSWNTIEEFWAIYEDKYLVLLDKTRQYLRFHTKRLKSGPNQPTPKAAIFLSAGFDASEWETAGMQRHAVNVPTEFYARFTRDVVRLAEEEGTAVDGRVISVLEGGYSDRALASGVLSHLSGLTDGQIYHDPKPTNEQSLEQRLNGLNVTDEDLPLQSVDANLTPVRYDPSWWQPTHLAELESLVTPPVPVALKKLKQGPLAHFSSPTQSFTAKVVDPTKLSHLQPARGAPVNPSRPVTPPPPDVDWATAAHALSALLVPMDRQTRSCRPDELAPPQVKKEKPAPPVLNSVKVDSSGRRLRGRKPATSYADQGSDEDKGLSTESKTSRRQTIADFQLATAEPPPPARSTSRRMSIASSVSSIGDRGVSRGPSIPLPSSRRPSVVPSDAPADRVSVKKGRGATTAAASRAPQRPPVPRVPSAYSNTVPPTHGKENDDIDTLTSGLKRVTLKMPSREEYEAREREKQKALESSKKKGTKTSNRKTPAGRTATTKSPTNPASGTAKRTSGRASKSSKTSSPASTPAPTMTPEPPHLQSAATAPLEQPEPVHPRLASTIAEQVPLPVLPQDTLHASVSEASRSSSVGIIEPPTDIRDSVITPEQLREQLPLPSFVTPTEAPKMASPQQREDTPPPPPPATGLQFVNYNAHSFDTAPLVNSVLQTSEPQAVAALQWLPPNTETTPPKSGSRPMSPAAKRQDLPVFTANSTIPFAAAIPAPAPQQGAQQSIPKTEEYKDVWEVPETPAR